MKIRDALTFIPFILLLFPTGWLSWHVIFEDETPSINVSTRGVLVVSS